MFVVDVALRVTLQCSSRPIDDHWPTRESGTSILQLSEKKWPHSQSSILRLLFNKLLRFVIRRHLINNSSVSDNRLLYKRL